MSKRARSNANVSVAERDAFGVLRRRGTAHSLGVVPTIVEHDAHAAGGRGPVVAIRVLRAKSGGVACTLEGISSLSFSRGGIVVVKNSGSIPSTWHADFVCTAASCIRAVGIDSAA